ncbi:MAG: GerAB/ArcD/ProY family transporter [Clostridia bacterium]|nr:GerAB/ArcD/ProY family transporter [Clostridia bacterium]
MEKTVSTNQAGLILCIFTIAIKLSALPALMFSYSGNDCYIACFISLVVDFIGTIILLHYIHKHKEKTFFELIRDSLGKTVAIIIQSILLIYFFVKCVLILQELHDYFIATLFEELNPIFFIIVLGLLILYCITKDFRTIGRVIQLVFWPTLVGITFTLIFPIHDLQIEKLFPIFEQGFYPIYKTIARTTFAFGDYIILLPLMGKIKFEEKSKKKLAFIMCGTLSFVFNFYIVFVGSFGKFSTSQTLALGELPLHNTTPATIGKLEWLTIVIWTAILLLNAIILAIATKDSFDTIFHTSDKNIGTIVITLGIVTTLSLTYLQLEKVIRFLVSPTFATIIGSMHIAIILILIISSIICSKKTNCRSSVTKNRRVKKC